MMTTVTEQLLSRKKMNKSIDKIERKFSGIWYINNDAASYEKLFRNISERTKKLKKMKV